MMRYLLLIIALCCSSAEAANFRHLAPNYPTYSATATATTASPGATVPLGYVGLSVEAQDLISGFYQGSSGTWNGVASASSFVGLAALLGANGSLRVGGSSCSTPTTPALTQTIANNLATLLTSLGAGWKLRYCLDVFANNASLAATQAGYLATALGAANVVLELNNEPISSGEFATIAAYQTGANAYISTVLGSVPGAKFEAWDDYSFGSTQGVINGLTPGVSGTAAVTYHWYNTNGGLTTPTNFINSSANFGSWSSNTIWAGSTPQRLTETNSVNIGGVNGLSNGLIAATWFINQAATLIPLGYAGVNVHMFFGGESAGKTQGIYNPFVLNADQNFAPGAIFYALLMVSKLEGQQLLPLSINNGTVVGLATLASAGKANFLLVNNSQTSYASVLLSQDVAWSTGTQLMLSGTSCNDPAPKLGGQPIGESGAWNGAAAPLSNGQPVIIPPCGVVFGHIQS